MTPDTIFAEAIAIDSAEQRAAFLDDSCRDDPALRREVEGLVRAYFQADDIAHIYDDGTTNDPAHKSPGRSEKQQTRRPGAAGTALRRVGQAGGGGQMAAGIGSTHIGRRKHRPGIFEVRGPYRI
jgi:hypothetical protein